MVHHKLLDQVVYRQTIPWRCHHQVALITHHYSSNRYIYSSNNNNRFFNLNTDRICFKIVRIIIIISKCLFKIWVDNRKYRIITINQEHRNDRREIRGVLVLVEEELASLYLQIHKVNFHKTFSNKILGELAHSMLMNLEKGITHSHFSLKTKIYKLHITRTYFQIKRHFHFQGYQVKSKLYLLPNNIFTMATREWTRSKSLIKCPKVQSKTNNICTITLIKNNQQLISLKDQTQTKNHSTKEIITHPSTNCKAKAPN